MVSEKRFKLQHINDLTDQEYMRLKKITDNGELITLGEVVDLLNEQQATIQSLKEENRVLRQTTKTQQIRIYCQDKEIQKLQERLNQIPKNIREVWIE